jgi:hypothetical protein
MTVDRRLLLAGALGAGALGALAPLRRAAAFQIELASPAETALMAARCDGVSVHQQVVRDLLVRFAALGPAEAEARVRAMACPICGCSLASALPADVPAADPPATNGP